MKQTERNRLIKFILKYYLIIGVIGFMFLNNPALSEVLLWFLWSFALLIFILFVRWYNNSHTGRKQYSSISNDLPDSSSDTFNKIKDNIYESLCCLGQIILAIIGAIFLFLLLYFLIPRDCSNNKEDYDYDPSMIHGKY